MFTIDLKDLATNIAFIKRVAGPVSRRRVEGLSVLRVTVTDCVASVSLAGFESAVTVRMSASGDDCMFLVQLDELASAVRETGSKAVAEFTVTDSALTIACAGVSSTVQFAAVDADKVPAMLEVSGDPALIVSGTDFSTAVLVLASSIGDDDTLPMLTGIRVESDGSNLEAATTDRFRMANASIRSASIPEQFATLLPGRPIIAFGKRAAKESFVSMTLQDNLIALESDSVSLVVRALDCEFPKWRQLFDGVAKADQSISFEFDALALAKRIKPLAARQQNLRIHVFEDFGVNTGVTICGHSHHDGELLSTFNLEVGDLTYNGDAMTVQVSTEYLASILATVPRGVKARVTLINPSRPLVIEWDNARVLLMPVRMPG